MAEEPKVAVEQTGESNPTSDNAKPTEPQSGQVNPALKYKVDRAGTLVNGDELVKGYNRGRMFDKVQSDLHKTQSEMQKLTAEYERTQAELNRIKQEQMIKETVSRLLPQQKSSNEEEEWPTEEQEMGKQIDQNELVRQIAQLTQTPVNNTLKALGLDGDNLQDVNSIIEQKLQQREAELNQQRELQERMKQIRDNDKNQLLTNFGSVLPEDRIKEILDMIDVAVTLQRRAEANITNTEYREQAIDDYANSRDLLMQAVDRIADAKIQSKQKAEQEEQEQQLLSGNFPGMEDLKIDPTEPILDPTKQRERRRKIIEAMAKRQDMVDAGKRAKGVGR